MELETTVKLQRTDASNKDFKQLVILLDQDLGVKYEEYQEFYNQFNQLDAIKNVVVAYWDGMAVSCGAIKEYDSDSMEVKRMFTLPAYRGRGLASKLLTELERWAVELSYKKSILETGTKQINAIALYTRMGYTTIENYGQYKDIETSICFEKQLNHH